MIAPVLLLTFLYGNYSVLQACVDFFLFCCRVNNRLSFSNTCSRGQQLRALSGVTRLNIQLF